MSKCAGYLPAGFTDSDDDFDIFEDNDLKAARLIPPVEKSEMEKKKERLIDLVELGDVEGIREELDHGSPKGMDIDEPLDGCWNLLFHACNQAQPAVVKFLVTERGANTNQTVGYESPMMILCNSTGDSEKVYEAVKVLVQAATSISSVNDRGKSALMFASSRGHVKVVELLLSLNDSYDAIDNEGNNALFWAIDGKQTEVAKLLMDAGIDLAVENTFGFTAKEYAEDENVPEIFALFPEEEEQYTTPADFMSYNKFEDIIADGSSHIPTYFPDIVKILNGSGCEKFIDKFSLAEISFQEFLTISDERLEEIGFELPLQRKMIRSGLSRFLQEPWKVSSLYVPKGFRSELSRIDILMILANVLRQLVIIEAQMMYITKLPSRDKRSIINTIEKFQINVTALKKHQSSIKLMSRPLLIKQKPKKSCKALWLISVIPLVAVFSYKFLKK